MARLPMLRLLVQIALGTAILSVWAVVLAPRINPYQLQVVNYIGINVVMAVSLNLINGHTGQFSIGHAGFMALGAYGSAAITYYGGPHVLPWLGDTLGLPLAVANGLLLNGAMLAGGLLAAFAGLVVGIPTLRLRGDYLAIATLGFGEIIRVIILNLDVVGGARGFTDIPELAGTFWIFAWAVITVAVIARIVGSTRGLAFLSIREDEIAAEAVGISTTRTKVAAFLLGAFFAGIGGGLFAHNVTYLHTNTFTFMKSIEYIAMVVLGGMGSITGSVVAAVVLTTLPEALRAIEKYRMVIYAALLIVLMLTRPQGLMGRRELSFDAIRRRLVRRAVALPQRGAPS
ncbi:MAG: branched-chain amino acid ABC transporter permease [bacterium]